MTQDHTVSHGIPLAASDMREEVTGNILFKVCSFETWHFFLLYFPKPQYNWRTKKIICFIVWTKLRGKMGTLKGGWVKSQYEIIKLCHLAVFSLSKTVVCFLSSKNELAAVLESWHPETFSELSEHQPWFSSAWIYFWTDFQIDNHSITHAGVIFYGLCLGFKCHVITPYSSYSTEQI